MLAGAIQHSLIIQADAATTWANSSNHDLSAPTAAWCDKQANKRRNAQTVDANVWRNAPHSLWQSGNNLQKYSRAAENQINETWQ